MKTLFSFLAFLSLGVIGALPATASTDVNVVGSSFTYSGVHVTTGTARRVDHIVRGSTQVVVQSSRIGVEIENLDATSSVFIGFDSALSTSTADLSSFAKEIEAGDPPMYIGALRAVNLWALAADGAGGAGVNIRVIQVHKE